MNTAEILKDLDGGGDLQKQQEILEALSQGLGINQYWRKTSSAQESGRESNTSYGAQLMSHYIESVSQGIKTFLKESEVKRGAPHVSARYLRQADPEVVAFLSLKAVIDSISKRKTLQKVASEIGTYIEDDIRYEKFREQNPKLFNIYKDKAAKATTYTHKRNMMINQMSKQAIDYDPWPKNDKVILGVKMVDIIIATTGLIEVLDVNEGTFGRHRTMKYISATPEAMEWVDTKNSRCELLTPNYLPCVIPPRDWTSPFNGGYHTNHIRPLTLVKTSHKNFLEEITNSREEMPMVYRAVNALQQTPWKINSRVLEVMRHIWDNEIDVPCLVSRKDQKEAMCPSCGQMVEMSNRNQRSLSKDHECFNRDEVVLKQWKVAAAKAHEANARMISKRIQVQKVLWIAEIMSPYREIYMPYQLDFRGRIYAAPFYLNPQGADYAKGLLTFAEGKPLKTEEAASWLAIHGANLYGYDKVSLTNRVEFICNLSSQIKAAAEDPYEHMGFWMEADKPWQFLAFCFEWAGYIRDGLDHVSYIPIALDGSCSGIQHFSAMLRDATGAEAVNLLPSEKPNDIYQVVCDRVLEKLKQDVEDPETNPYAGGWLKINPDRKLTKRQVMTLPYGSTLFSCKEYTNDYLNELLEERRYTDPDFSLPWGEKERYKAVVYMANLIWKSIEEVVVGARECMDWLKQWARKVTKEQLPITWNTPVGFPVYQAYPDTRRYTVKTSLGDSLIKMSIHQQQNTINKKRMEQGISPNFVHSMDASHLILSVEYALRRGIGNFAMVHDSFGTHAADTDSFSCILRNAFVDMYSKHDVLQEFKQSMLNILPEENQKNLPQDLEKGSLNLEKVRVSDFFFA